MIYMLTIFCLLKVHLYYFLKAYLGTKYYCDIPLRGCVAGQVQLTKASNTWLSMEFSSYYSYVKLG
jgi:hypothetical protein